MGFNFGIIGIVTLIGIGMNMVYSGYFLSTRGATPGKMVIGLQVIRSDGSGITFGRGAGRQAAHMVSGMLLGIGYMIAGFDDQKRALHDHICDTRVIYK